MASINDWAAKAAHRIVLELPPHRGEQPREERIAAIIATFAEPLMQLARDSRREHYHCDDSWFCCGKCTHPDHGLCNQTKEEDHEHDASCYVGSHVGYNARTSGVCNCGADEWNARVDAVLEGRK